MMPFPERKSLRGYLPCPIANHVSMGANPHYYLSDAMRPVTKSDRETWTLMCIACAEMSIVR
jgi:hypothetical protein